MFALGQGVKTHNLRAIVVLPYMFILFMPTSPVGSESEEAVME